MENEVKKEQKTFKEWWNERKIVQYCKDHPDITLTVVGGLLSITGGIIRIIGNKSEYEDNVFVDVDDQVYKIPAKQMKTIDKSSPRTKKK